MVAHRMYVHRLVIELPVRSVAFVPKLKDVSRKLVVFRLASMVIFRPYCLNVPMMHFLAASASWPGVSFSTARPSSL